MPMRSVSLPEELDRYITSRVETGAYQSPSEVVRDALLALQRDEEDYEEKLHALRAAIAEGDASWIAEGTSEEIFAQIRRETGLPPEKH